MLSMIPGYREKRDTLSDYILILVSQIDLLGRDELLDYFVIQIYCVLKYKGYPARLRDDLSG